MFRQSDKLKGFRTVLKQAYTSIASKELSSGQFGLNLPSLLPTRWQSFGKSAWKAQEGFGGSMKAQSRLWEPWSTITKRQYARQLDKRSGSRGRQDPAELLKQSAGVQSRPRAELIVMHRGKRIVGTILFCTGLSATCCFASALWEESLLREEWRVWRNNLLHQQRPLPAWIKSSPKYVKNMYREFWVDVPLEQRAVGLVLAMQGLVFLAFNSKRARLVAFMDRYFIHWLPPLPTKLITLCTANFAHKSFGHLAFNSIALWSFGVGAARDLGVAQFLGFYVSAGLCSALLSDLGRLWSLRGGASLGASGAVYACFALMAMTKPDQEVVLIFLPMLPFNIADALNCMLALDIAGAVLGWRRFDHFGHLGGGLFGLYYALSGRDAIWPKFQAVAEDCWDRLGGKP